MKHLYRWLLARHPLREQFGDEMVQVYEQVAAEQRARGRLAYLRFCARESWGLMLGYCAGPRQQGELTMRHKRLVTACALAGFALALGGALYWARTPYTSTAALRITPAMIPARIAPSADANPDQVLPRIFQSVLSKVSLANVINTLNLYPGERKLYPMETVIEQIRTDLTVTREAGDTIRIRFTYADPLIAQTAAVDFCSRIIDEYIRLRATQTLMTVEFLRDRQEAVGKRWVTALARVKAAASATADAERLQLEADIARKDYEDLSTKLAEAETAKHMEERGQGPRLELMDGASLPVGFRPPMLAVIPLALAGGGGGWLAGWALAWLLNGRRTVPQIA